MNTKKIDTSFFRIIVFFLLYYGQYTFAGEEGHGKYFCNKPQELHNDRACTHTGPRLNGKYDCGNFYFKCKEDGNKEGCPDPYRTVELLYTLNNENKELNRFNRMDIKGADEGNQPFKQKFRFQYYVGGALGSKPYEEADCSEIKYPKLTNFNIRVLGNSLIKGQKMLLGDALCSENKEFVLMLQKKDGHLCIYKALADDKMQFVWCSGKYSYGENQNTSLIMQDDGNLVLYKDGNLQKASTGRDEPAIWSPNTHREDSQPNKLVGEYAQLSDEGVLIISGKNPNGWGDAWTSGTKGAANGVKFSYCKYSGQN